MSKQFKPNPPIARVVVLKLRDFRPRYIPGLQLSHFSTMPSPTGTTKAVAVYQQAAS